MSFWAAWLALRVAGIAPDISAIIFQHTLAPIRFAKGYMVKSQRHRRAIASKRTARPLFVRRTGRSFDFMKGKQEPRSTTTVELTPVARAPIEKGVISLDQILSYPVISSIAESSHFLDMQNLMVASKSVCNAFLGSLGSQSTALRKKTCADRSKTECWCCKSQICKVSAESY